MKPWIKVLWVGLIVMAGAGLGYGAFRLAQGPSCPYDRSVSDAGNLALSVAGSPSAIQSVKSLEGSFMQQFRESCLQLCQDRAQLSQRLVFAQADDKEARTLVERINQEQSWLESLTWQHVVSLRDALPPAGRERFVKQIQAQWAKSQMRLKKIAQAAPCQPDLHGSPK